MHAKARSEVVGVAIVRIEARFRRCGFTALGTLAIGCGGATPLMHPAHTLPPEKISVGAGVSSQFVLGEADDQIEASRAAAPVSSLSPTDTETQLTEVIAHSLLAPGLAPWVGARAGVGYDSDAGLAYTGRSVRVDGRHAFQDDQLAISLGLGANGVLTRRSGDNVDATETARQIPGVDTSAVTGWGVDVPIIAGWRSTAELINVFGGIRGGYGHVFGHVLITTTPGTGGEQGDLDAWHAWGGGVLGLMVGVPPIFGVIELDGGVHYGTGTVDPATGQRIKGEFTGITLGPAAALVVRL